MIAYALASIVALIAVGASAVAVSTDTRGGKIVYAAVLVITSFLTGIGAAALLSPADARPLLLPLGLPWLGAQFRVDALAGFFLVVINFGAALTSLFAMGYGRHEEEPGRVLPFYPVYVAAMNIVLLAADAFTFLVSWEFMSLTSWALVIAHHREKENLRAGYVYLLMASFGTLALLLAFGLLAGPQGNYAFDAIRSMQPTSGLASLVLLLALIGTGSKAGLVPLHAWLPLAHPAAPSHVSALMSGVMTKVAVYGFVRIAFDLIGATQWWWSLVVLAAAGVTASVGVLYALMQRDVKRVLAYSTIENIGIIFAALGLALAFKSYAMSTAAALAMTAALLHVFNHSLFKNLLFCGAGALSVGAGERDLEKLGGLIHRMPHTAFLFLIGCMAISALPPLNGFVSEWLTFQSILLSPQLPSWALKLMVPAVGALLALAAALAGACFVRLFGIGFLGRARSDTARSAHEADRYSLAAMYVLAATCLIAGILPGLIIDALAPVVDALTQSRMPTQRSVEWLSIVPIAEARSSYNGLLVFTFIVASATFAAIAIHRLASDRIRRGASAWDCGYPDPSPRNQYTADSLAQPIRRVFGTLIFGAREIGQMPAPGATAPARLTVIVRDPLWDSLYAPLARFIEYAADRLNVLQFLTIRRYLALVFTALILLLLVLATWP